MNATTDTAIQDYLDQLRRELADLPPAEVDEIVQDLEPQLAELAEELGPELSATALADRLGSPAEYAMELRGAMDMPGTRRPPVWVPRTLLWLLVVSTVGAACGGYLSAEIGRYYYGYVVALLGLVLVPWLAAARNRSAMDEVAALPEVRWLTAVLTSTENRRWAVGYVTSLLPAWRLVRVVLVFLSTLWLMRWVGYWDSWPEVLASGFAVFTAVAGYRAHADRRWLWVSVPLTGWAFGVAVTMTRAAPELLAGYGF